MGLIAGVMEPGAAAPGVTAPQTPYGIPAEIPVPSLTPERPMQPELQGQQREDFDLATELSTDATPEAMPIDLSGKMPAAEAPAAPPAGPLAGVPTLQDQQAEAFIKGQRGELRSQQEVELGRQFEAHEPARVIVAGRDYGITEKLTDKELDVIGRQARRPETRGAVAAEQQRRIILASKTPKTPQPGAQAVTGATQRPSPLPQPQPNVQEALTADIAAEPQTVPVKPPKAPLASIADEDAAFLQERREAGEEERATSMDVSRGERKTG